MKNRIEDTIIMAYSIKQAVKNKNDELFTPKILVEVIYIYIYI